MTLRCSKCGEDRPPSDFALGQSRGRQYWCKPCMNAASRANYAANKERYFRLARERDQRIDELITEAKDRPCMDCGVWYPPYVMDFDHRDPTTKTMNVSLAKRRRMAVQKILAEIEKCDVVCANCHRQRTDDRNPSGYTRRTEAA